MTNVVPNVVLEFLPDDTKIACPLQIPDLCNRGILIVKCATAYTGSFWSYLASLPSKQHLCVLHIYSPLIQ